MTEWLMRFGLWLAKQNGWTEPIVVPPGPAEDLRMRLHEAETKLHMRGVALHDAQDRVTQLERRLVQPYAPAVSTGVMARTGELIRAQDALDRSGEAKRHAVYAQLIKDYPTLPKRELALAIEVALTKEG